MTMKILYGVPDNNRDNAIRSEVVIEHLLQYHEVRVVTSGWTYSYLRESLPGLVYQLGGFHRAYRLGSIEKLESFSAVLESAPGKFIREFRQYSEAHADFEPGLVISDMEEFAFLYGGHHGIPVISLGSRLVIDRCSLDIEIPRSEEKLYRNALAVINVMVPRCLHYIITAFFTPEVVKGDTTLVPPLLRESVLAMEPGNSGEILVYLPGFNREILTGILTRVPREHFLVYGYNADETAGNVRFMKDNEKQFSRDMASSMGVIADGGFTTVAEALHFEKPLLLVPRGNDFEAFVNASFVEKLGCGVRASRLNPDVIKSFLYDYDIYRDSLARHETGDGREALEIIDRYLDEREGY